MTESVHTVYVLDSPALTAYGDWRFEGPVTVEQARDVLGDGFSSAIGHQGAADFLSALLEVAVPVKRVRVEMAPGDLALVVRILDRMPEGKILTRSEMVAIRYELAILTRLS